MLVSFVDNITGDQLFEMGLDALPPLDCLISYTSNSDPEVVYEVKGWDLVCHEDPDIPPSPPLPGTTTFAQPTTWKVKIKEN